MTIQLKPSLSRAAAAAAVVLGALAVFATGGLHHPHAPAHAVGRSAIALTDAARATVIGVAHRADASIIVLAEYMIDVLPPGTPRAV